MRKLITSILVLLFVVTCCSMVSFAAPSTNVYFGDGSETVTATEDTYTVEVFVNPKGTEFEYETDAYYVESLGIPVSVTGGTIVINTASLTNLTFTKSNEKFSYYTSGDGYEPTGVFSVGTIVVTREVGVASTTLTIGTCAPTLTSQNLTINWPSDEEVFEITKTATSLEGTDTMKDANGADVAAAGEKVVAIFAKNVSDTELAAGSYGIIFGGVRYPGQKAVPGKTAWAVKLVGPADKLPAGDYAYGIFAAGQTDVDAGTYTVQ